MGLISIFVGFIYIYKSFSNFDIIKRNNYIRNMIEVEIEVVC